MKGKIPLRPECNADKTHHVKTEKNSKLEFYNFRKMQYFPVSRILYEILIQII